MGTQLERIIAEASATTQPSPFAPATLAPFDPAVQPPQPALPAEELTALGQLRENLRGIIRDPFGFVVGSLTQLGRDLLETVDVRNLPIPTFGNPNEVIEETIALLTEEELLDPAFRERLIASGFDPDRIQRLAVSNRSRTRAASRIGALVVGGAVGRAAGGLIGPAETLIGAGTKSAAEGLAFGVTAGALTPLEEGQTRAGNALTFGVISVPLGAMGGVTSLATRRFLRTRGVKPEVDVPEVTPTLEDFNVRQAAREPLNRRPGDIESTRPPITDPPPQLAAEVPAPEPVGPAVNQVLDAVQIGPTRGPLRPPGIFRRFYTRFFDDLHPIQVAVTELTGSRKPGRLPGLDDPYILARLSRGSVPKATEFLETGPVDFKTFQRVGPGMREILAPVEQAGLTSELRALLVSERAIELAARDIESPVPLNAARRVITEAGTATRVAARQIRTYQEQLLNYLRDSGAISTDAVVAIREANQKYVPFYRSLENVREQALPGGPPTRANRFANLFSGVRRIRGGRELPIIDPLESIVRNTYAMVQLADRQAVSQALVRLAQRTPEQRVIEPVRAPTRQINIEPEIQRAFREAGAELTPEVMAELGTTFRPSTHLGPGEISVIVEGQRRFFRVDSELQRSLLAVDRPQLGWMVNILSFPSRVLKAGATLTPQFIARNPFRDQFSATVFSRFGFRPGVDLLRGVFEVVGQREAYRNFRRSGGEFATLVRETSAERVRFQRTLDDLLKSDNQLSRAWRLGRNPLRWLEGLRVVSETMEEATRVREFQRALEAGGDPRIAAFFAREVTLDFSRMGTSVRTWNSLAAFLNSNLQGLDKIVREFRERPTQAGAKAVAAITVPTIALYLANMDDPNYWNLTDARRDFFWNFPKFRFNEESGKIERTGEFFSLPKPFDLGLIFGTMPERALRWIQTRDPEALEGFAQNYFSTTPADPDAWIPTAVRPLIENWANRSFFSGRPIVPEGEAGLLPQEQAGLVTGETARIIGVGLGVSPRKVENLIRGYTGGLGTTALRAADLVAERFTGRSRLGIQSPIERAPLLGPFITTFNVPEPTINSKPVERFYDSWDTIDATMQTLRRQEREIRAEDFEALAKGVSAELAAYPIFIETVTALGEMRRVMNFVRTQNEIPREQREQDILQMGRMYRMMAEHANEAYRRIREALDEGNQPRATGPVGILREPLAELTSPFGPQP